MTTATTVTAAGPGPQVSIAEAARRLGISENSVRHLTDSGALTHTRFGSTRRIPEAALAEYIAAHTYPASTTTAAG